MKLLVVEDDESLASLLRQALTERHYQLDLATDGQTGWEFAEAFQYDLILLDWMLPRLDGLSFCQQLRAQGNLTPVLLMTANEAQSNKIRGLDSGADDYLIKPFDFGELLARVRALLRRGKDAATPLLVWGDICLDPQSCEVFCGERPLHLTAKEYGLLELFLRHPQRIFNADALLDALWDFEDAPSENAVRAHIKTLRRKLRQSGVEDVLETVYGLGYRLKAAPTAKLQRDSELPSRSVPEVVTAVVVESQVSKSSHSASTDSVWPSSSVPVSTGGAGQAALREVWLSARQQYLEKLDCLEGKLSGAMAFGPVAFRVTEEAEQIHCLLHALKGGLGTFGLTQASAIAQQAQALFLSHSGLSNLSKPIQGETVQSTTQAITQATDPQLVITQSVISQLLGYLATIRGILEMTLDPCISLMDPAVMDPSGMDPAISTEVEASRGVHWLLVSPDEKLWQQLKGAMQTGGIQLHWSKDRFAGDAGLALGAIATPSRLILSGVSPEIAPGTELCGIILDLKILAPQTTSGLAASDLAASDLGMEALFSSPLLSALPLMGLTLGNCLEEQVQAARLGCRCCLPRTTPPAQILARAEDLFSRAPVCNARILVVDDDRPMLQLIEQILSPRGFDVQLLEEPQAFSQTLEASNPDLIILDYEMPQFTGLDLCRVVRSSPRWQALPVLFISVYQDAERLRSMFEAGADDFVGKPIHKAELIQRVLNRLERTRQRRQCQGLGSMDSGSVGFGNVGSGSVWA